MSSAIKCARKLADVLVIDNAEGHEVTALHVDVIGQNIAGRHVFAQIVKIFGGVYGDELCVLYLYGKYFAGALCKIVCC